ncbi:hypothetical protein ACIP98_21520 [Streptomyces sp. NPDC088354]|uniref:hypothetical protein n=1 Tax=Streptomyces sp. NPDC088354 TaxID=3365856 RepID=UPI0038289991
MTISQAAPPAVVPPASVVAGAASAPAARNGRRRMPPPVRLLVQTGVTLAALVALCAATVVGALAVRSDARELRDSSAHRAAAAAELRFSLADLDAQRANQLVPGYDPTDRNALVGNRLMALITAHERRAEISDLLRQLGGDDGHADQVRELLDALGRYDDASGRAAYLDEKEPDRAAGRPPRVALNFSAEAGEIMHSQLLPEASTLAKDYDARAAGAARAAKDTARRFALIVGGLGLVTVLVLLWWQRDLARRHRRLFNPALVVATVAALAVTIAGVVSFTSSAGDVEAGVSEGLRPWSRLGQARAVAAESAAAQSRWVVNDADPERRAELDSLMQRLDGLLAPGTYASAGERPAYADVAARYGHFRADDQKLRAHMTRGELDSAVDILTNVGGGKVGFDFWDFATTLERLTRAQQADFASRTSEARSQLDGWPAIPLGALGLAAVLVLVGVRPRLAEYR